MSEVRLVIRDASRSVHATSPGDFADRVVAALSAEPETIEELDKAVRRFHAPDERSFFGGFRSGINDEPYDAGIVIIDLEARIVVCDSSYSSPGWTATLWYDDGRCATDPRVSYHLPDDWVFTSEIENWRARTEQRRHQRREHPALDVRAVLYGQVMLKAIAGACSKAFRELRASDSAAGTRASFDLSGDGELPVAAQSRQSDREYDMVREIHAKWMLTPRDDLRGQTPRDVILAKHDVFMSDLQDRQTQWTQQGTCPPPLDPGSRAFRFGGFGTHEIVIYYQLLRHLLGSCRRRLAETADKTTPRADLEFGTPGDFLTTEVPRLERSREEWLDEPDPEFHGRTPRSVIDHERARIPEALSGNEAVIDHDCPLCQMMADMPGPMFWHLDGCNMDPDFAFSFHRTHEEWEEETLTMTPEFHQGNNEAPSRLNRRAALRSTLAAAAATGGASAAALAQPDTGAADARRASPKSYRMKKSINLWAFPYPQRMTLRECLQLAKNAGFEGIELNYDLDNDLSPKSSGDHYRAIRKKAEEIGIAISGVCSFLYWPYSLTDSDRSRRARALELARLMIEAAHELGTENLLTIAGSTYIPWVPDREPVPIDVCDRRAREAIGQLLPFAEKLGVYLNIENICFNGYLTTPGEMNAFVDRFGSKYVQVHFDTGNVMLFQFPEHWIPILGRRIQNVHFKEFTKKGTDHSLEAFRTLLDGTTNWPAVMDAFEQVGYNGYVTFEYFHPFLYYPEALIEQSSDALDRILGRKAARSRVS